MKSPGQFERKEVREVTDSLLKVELTILNPREYDDRVLSEAEMLDWFTACDAGWMYEYPADSARPHAELTSGKCSDGYFNCPLVLQYPNLAEILGRQLARKLKKHGISTPGGIRVDRVIGSPYAAIIFSYEVAKALVVPHAFCEKDPKDSQGKSFVWRRLTLPHKSTVLRIEELITTTHTTSEVERAVKLGNTEIVRVLPIVGALIHRPPKLPAQYPDIRVVALVEKEVHAWEPKDCPLCKAGSQCLRPKTHWLELTGKA